jgi:ABC-type uncharacterized transport system permease subunit
MLVTNVPARVMARPLDLDSWLAVYMVVASVVVVWISRRLFRAALQRYRSASS